MKKVEKIQLKRCLSLSEIVIYGVGLILGAGIYVLIGSAAGIAGNMLWLSFTLAAIVASFTAMSYAELAAIFPEAGAEYIYAKNAFGWDKMAWVFGFIAIVIGFTTASAVALGFARYLSYFIPMNQVILAIGLLVLMTGINFWGIKESARFNALATTIEVGGLVLLIAIGGYFIFKGDIPLANLTEFPPLQEGSSISWLPVVSASALIFFAYMGFEDIANIAEEAENPAQTLPKAFIYALLISTIIYILVAVVSVSVIPFSELAKAEQPLSMIMSKLIGGFSPELIALIALFATANTVLITLIVCARMMYGMAKSNSFPRVLASVHQTRQTPYVAIMVTGFISIIFLFFKKVEVLAAISDVGIFILFFIVNLSNIVLRYRRPDIHRVWRAPFNIGRLPVLSVLGVLSCLFMLININHPVHLGDKTYSAQLVGMCIFALAIPLSFVFNRKPKV
ncbi:APC family permease [Cocleimonas sp. KMM 6892]|uniref:APC family permease n=1 Tax=unclassified Cocleimonas TaxID=2639732 RepID=UPI002DB5610C|nr:MULTISPECIES: APC family permease [unclassified Cocleimonas]MEB8432956.1 APC family permease [Cocleimonas sp. KMM 6892]MEC4716063.1 APC family permease [Cocleimonas sp. KMM 6895]MEC4745524.1 APC family permease [Cocleimonas sp. KMM 6896]